MYFKQVMKNFNLLNFILLISSLIFAYSFLLPRLDSNVKFIASSIKNNTAEKNIEEPPTAQSPVFQDFMTIADHNLFHPERKIPPEKNVEKVTPRPDIVLYATIVMDDSGFAFIEDRKAPYSTPGREKRQIVLKKGDNVSGYTLKEITPKYIVLAKGEEKMTVLLDDAGKRRTGADAASRTTYQPMSGALPTNVLSNAGPVTPAAQTPAFPLTTVVRTTREEAIQARRDAMLKRSNITSNKILEAKQN